jgi:hypothetical protein
MGERERGVKAERFAINYYCFSGHANEIAYAATVEPEEIPLEIDCPNCGLPAGTDQSNPPQIVKHEPYKTHLAYVKERRTEQEAKELLEEAIDSIRTRREAASER